MLLEKVCLLRSQKISLNKFIFQLKELGPDCSQRTAFKRKKKNKKDRIRAVLTSEFNVFISLLQVLAIRDLLMDLPAG